jgi:penicillin amidase
MRKLSLLAVLLSACLPLSMYAPPSLPKDGPLTLAMGPGGPGAKVEVLLDGRGIPHIFAANENDAAYGLGFMHARDRLFQVILLTHASQGRLTELFGEELLPVDQRLRLIAWNLDKVFAGLGERDRRILEAYAAGVNAGAAHAGRSAEMKLLGLEAPAFTAQDSLGILRLQAWQLSVDFVDELVRAQVASLAPANDPRVKLFDSPTPTGGVPIVPFAKLPVAATPASSAATEQTRAESRGDGRAAGDKPPPYGTPLARAVVASLGLDRGGASNSWAVHGSRTASGKPVLCNDPHLEHRAPGVFYLAHLETPDFTVAGATMPGGPQVLIGFTRHLAWGMTTSYSDTQDLLRLQAAPGRTDAYLLDGAPVPFETRTQSFRLGVKKDAKVFLETWRATRFGPVLPPGYAAWTGAQDFALLSPFFEAGGPNEQPVSAFFDFARAKNIDEATAAIARVPMASQNITLAFTDGTIGYRLAAYTPERPAGQTGRVPRDGSAAAASFGRQLPQAEKPQATNPEVGYVVTANQRVIPDEDPRTGAVGTTAISPYRARRIHERLDALLAAKKPTADELLAIQGDTVSVAGRELAPLLGARCPDTVPGHPPERVKAFCDAVRAFDGDFKVASLHALPYQFFLEAATAEAIALLGVADEKVAARLKSSLIVEDAVDRALHAPPPSGLFGADEKALFARAAGKALTRLVADAGADPADWRWGKLHTLTLQGPLAAAPLVGGFFRAPTFEVPGDSSAIRAEGGLPVEWGSALRMVVELSDPPKGRVVIDTGQSGHPREPHFFDQFADWNAIHPVALPIARADVEAVTEARIQLLP